MDIACTEGKMPKAQICLVGEEAKVARRVRQKRMDRLLAATRLLRGEEKRGTLSTAPQTGKVATLCMSVSQSVSRDTELQTLF